MFWAISRIAAADFAERRDQGLQAHLDYLRSQKDILVLSGATTSDDAKQYVGSLLIVNVKTRAEAQRFAEGDPFTQSGMFTGMTITRMNKGQFNPQAAEGA
jgi:uncharacterized protein YciI